MKSLTGHIGGVLKVLRERKGMSLDEVSRLTTVSKAMLGQIERGESNPTVLTLWKISSGLQVPFSDFLPEEKSNEANTVESTDNILTVLSLAKYRESTNSETLLITLKANSSHQSCAHAKGVVEDILPINGVVRIYVGDSLLEVVPHQMISFQADVDHTYENMGNDSVYFYNVIHY